MSAGITRVGETPVPADGNSPTTILPEVDGGSLLRLLFGRAQPHLRREELEHLAWGAADYAETVASRHARLAERLAWEIVERFEGGQLNDAAVSELSAQLWHLVDTSKQLGALAIIGRDAANDLAEAGRAAVAADDHQSRGVSAGAGVDLNSPYVLAGAAAVSELLATIGKLSDDGLADSPDGRDTRNYDQIADAIDACLQQNYVAGTEGRRQGLLLSLADVLCQEADSRFSEPAVIDPLQAMRRQVARRAAQ